MKIGKILTVSLLSLSLLSAPAIAGDLLTGTTKLACEAILCLSSPTQPAECMPSVRKYFSIVASKPHETIAKRRSFLRLCPTSNNAVVSGTIEEIVNRKIEFNTCDVNYLNFTLQDKALISKQYIARIERTCTNIHFVNGEFVEK